MPTEENTATVEKFRKSVGLSAQPQNNYSKKGVDKNGNTVYTSNELNQQQDPKAAMDYVRGVLEVLRPFKVLDREEASDLEVIGGLASDAAFLGQLGMAAQSGNSKLFTNLVLQRYGVDLAVELSGSPESAGKFGAALGAYQLYSNWDLMSDAQKAIGLANVGMQTTDTFAGTNIENMVIPGTESYFDGQGLNVGTALSAAGLGISSYELAKNWSQLDALGKTVGVGQTAMQTIQLAKDLGMIGNAAASTTTGTAAVAQGTNTAISTGNAAANTGTAVNTGNTATTGTAGADAATGGSTNWGGYAGVVSATYDGYNKSQDFKNRDAEDRGTQVARAGGRAVGAWFSGGLSEAGIAIVDAIGGDGTVEGWMDDTDDFMTSTAGRILLPGLGDSAKAINKGLGKLLGNTTKYTEYRNLKRELEDGNITEDEFKARVGQALQMGKSGRKSIDPEADYLRALESGATEEEAEKARTYATLVKEGKDKESIELLRGRDIVGYGNISQAISEMAGKPYKDISDSDRERYAQHLLDRGAVYSSKGSFNVRKSKELSNEIAALSRGENVEGNIASEKAFGVGAITVSSNGAIPEGYVKSIDNPDGSVVAVPAASASTAPFNAENAGNAQMAVSQASNLYRKWDRNMATDQVETPGIDPSVSMVAGINSLMQSNPKLASAYLATVGLNESDVLINETSRDKARIEAAIAAQQAKGNFREPITLADGTVVQLTADSADRAVRYQERAGRRNLQVNDFSLDYTNDLDYMAGGAGITLGRLMNGNASEDADLIGARLGNAALGSIGYGQDLDEANFGIVVNNLRSVYANSGISNKEEAYILTNKMLEEGRVNESQAALMQQNINIVFDGDYGYATTYINPGRFDGINNLIRERNVPDRFLGSGEVDPRNGKIIARVGKTYPPTYFYSDGSREMADSLVPSDSSIDTGAAMGEQLGQTATQASTEMGAIGEASTPQVVEASNKAQTAFGTFDDFTSNSGSQEDIDNAVGV